MSGFHILHIEDNLDHAELVRRSLENAEEVARITHLTDGASALDYLFEVPPYNDLSKFPPPDIVILDLRIPKIDGLEVVRRLKSDDRVCAIPVIVLTSSGAEADIERASQHHANSYLMKPLDFADFKSQMDSFRQYWFRYNVTMPRSASDAGSAGS